VRAIPDELLGDLDRHWPGQLDVHDALAAALPLTGDAGTHPPGTVVGPGFTPFDADGSPH